MVAQQISYNKNSHNIELKNDSKEYKKDEEEVEYVNGNFAPSHLEQLYLAQFSHELSEENTSNKGSVRSSSKENTKSADEKETSLYSFQNNVNQTKEDNRRYFSTLGIIGTIVAAMSFITIVAVVLSLLVEFDVIGSSSSLSNNTDYLNSSLAVNELNRLNAVRKNKIEKLSKEPVQNVESYFAKLLKSNSSLMLPNNNKLPNKDIYQHGAIVGQNKSSNTSELLPAPSKYYRRNSMQSPEARNYVAYIPVPINNDDEEEEDYDEEYEDDEYYDEDDDEYEEEYYYEDEDEDSYEDYSEEEETRPSRNRRKHNGGSSRRNKHRYNSKRKRPFDDEDRKGDKFRNRKDSAVKKERIPFLVPLMMVPENQRQH